VVVALYLLLVVGNVAASIPINNNNQGIPQAYAEVGVPSENSIRNNNSNTAN
jgi:hypothetical protein